MFQLSKVVNEIYHQYNQHQYPFVSLIVNMYPQLRLSYILMFQLSKVVNEIYHQYNRQQYPFVSLIVNMEKGKVSGDFYPVC